MKDGKKYVVVYERSVFFLFSVTFCFVDVRHAHSAPVQPDLIFSPIDDVSFETLIGGERERDFCSEQWPSHRNLSHRRLYVKHVHIPTRDKTIYRCFITSSLISLSLSPVRLLTLPFLRCTWPWMPWRERELKCTVDFDFSSRLAYVCHRNLSFAYVAAAAAADDDDTTGLQSAGEINTLTHTLARLTNIEPDFLRNPVCICAINIYYSCN